MRRRLTHRAALLAAFAAATSLILVPAGTANSDNPATHNATNHRGTTTFSIDFTFAPPDQRPACIMAMGGVLTLESSGVAHANRLPNGRVNVASQLTLDFSSGSEFDPDAEWTARANYHWQDQGEVNTPSGIAFVAETPIDVDFVSSSTGEVIRTTWHFRNGVDLGSFGFPIPLGLGFPMGWEFVTCR